MLYGIRFQAQKLKANGRKDMLAQLKKVAKESQKESRKQALASQKHAREAQIRARRLSKEMMVYWKRFVMRIFNHRRRLSDVSNTNNTKIRLTFSNIEPLSSV